MTSDPKGRTAVQDVFVHVRHPDGTSDIAGRYRSVRPPAGQPYGEFEYVGSWLRNSHGRAFPLDPANLPLQPGPVTARRRGLLHGVLADATPDRWGRRIIEQMRAPGPPLLSGDWLLASGDERVGCLAFSTTPTPPRPNLGFAAIEDLATIADGFERLAKGDHPGGMAERLWRAGASLGGARPKAVVAHEGALWIAKFERHDDDYDQCSSEHAAMRLAEACGIRVAPTRVMTVEPRKVVLVRRFDRTDEPFQPSCHYLSGLSALGYDDTTEDGSYAELAGFLRRHGAQQVADRRELFRRMMFNVLCGNRDDHLKNHGFVRAADGGWRLSPAFDIVPQPDMYDVQAIGLGIMGALPTRTNYLSRIGDFDLDAREAEAIVAEMIGVMRPWRRRFAEWGVPEPTIRRLERAFSRQIGDDPEGEAGVAPHQP